MNVRQTILIPVLGLAFLINSATAGVLDDNLAEKVKSLRSDEMVKVWIKLPRLEEPSKVRSSANAVAATRAGRYQYAAERFRQGHRIAQAELLSVLGGLERQNVASKVKGHWVANIVEAEVAVSQLEQLAARSDVDKIYAEPRITTIPAVPGQPVEPMADTVSENINFINAPAAWAAGYTGAGRIVCSFDTGVDGDHPALLANWKGHDGDFAAAWFDPKRNEPFPHTFPLSDGVKFFNPEHGTHTMGTMVGNDVSRGYRVGVAPDAKWISAGILDLLGVSLIDAFEWAADPDGDPNSVDDLPDVINHSWGVQDIACQNVFYDLIDNLETLGIVQIFAAGNSGNLGDSTIYNPADGDRDSLDCFAVGALDSLNQSPPVVLMRPAYGSSLGPSLCNDGHKPNVVAPGLYIISSWPGGGYYTSTGTSMAAPHVAGLVALLRQKNPNATVDEIKRAILVSARDYTYSLPNDTLGWGVIDCKAALDSLSGVNAVPNVRVYAYDHAPINAGDTVRGTMVLQNLGASVADVSATIIGSNPDLTVLSGSAYFEDMAEGDTVRSDDTIKVIVADGILYGTILSLDMQISGTGYTNNAKLHFLVEPHTSRALVTHNSGRIQFSLTNFGTYGLGSTSFYPAGGAGFKFDDSANDLYEGGLMIGINGNQVSDGVRNSIGEWDGDFRVAPGGNIFLMTPSPKATQESFSKMNDERAENPIGIELQQSSYSFADPSIDDFVIIRYIMRNTNDYSLNGIYAGLYMDWDVVPGWSNDVGGFDWTGEFLWMAHSDFPLKINWRGTKVLHGNTTTAVTQMSGLISYPINGGDGYTEAEKFASLTAGFAHTDDYKASSGDYNQVLAVGPINLVPGAVDTVAFALIAGIDSTAISAAAAAAQAAYDNMSSSTGSTVIGTAVAELGATVVVPITINTDNSEFPDSVIGFTIPLQYESSQLDKVVIDSVRFADSLLNDVNTILKPLEGIFIIDRPDYEPPLADTTYMANAYFSIDSATVPEVVRIDTTVYDDEGTVYSYHFVQNTGDTIIPSLGSGAIVIGYEPGLPIIHLDYDSLTIDRTPPFDSCFLVEIENYESVEVEVVYGGYTYAEWHDDSLCFGAQYEGGFYFDLTAYNYWGSVTEQIVYLVTDVDDGAVNSLPSAFALSQNYPNPFNPSTIIKFDLPTRSKVEVAVFNVLGQLVETLVNEVKPAGRYAVTWDGTDSRGREAAAGVYLYRIKTDDYTASKKMILLK